MALFSVITVTFNNIDGLRKTKDSVTVQNCDDYEWIVIDGGSTDGSQDILDDTNALLTSEPDNGIYDAMNKGIIRATGDYLIFMNAGDQFAAPDTLSRTKTAIADMIENTGEAPDFLYGDAREQSETDPAQTHLKPAREHQMAVIGMFTHHQAMIYRRALLAAPNLIVGPKGEPRSDIDGGLFYDVNYNIAADYKFTIQFIRKSRIIFRITDFPICIFESGGVSQKRVKQARKEQFDIRKNLGGVPIWLNGIIYGMQTLSYQMRRLSPKLYWKMKSQHKTG